MTQETTSLPWQCGLPSELLTPIQRGTMKTRYKGRKLLKSPFDLALYTQLIDRLKPRTVLEVGTNEAGSSVWFADMLRSVCGGGKVVGVDVDPGGPPMQDPDVTIMKGDALNLAQSFTPQLLASLPRPFLVVEDSAHRRDTSLATLEFFHPILKSGEYIVIEDGVVMFLPEKQYRKYDDDGPVAAIKDFLARHGGEYEVDRAICDQYGQNVTWNPNGWLRKR